MSAINMEIKISHANWQSLNENRFMSTCRQKVSQLEECERCSNESRPLAVEKLTAYQWFTPCYPQILQKKTPNLAEA